MKILIQLLVNAVALMGTAYLVPGFRVTDFKTAILAAIVLALINTFIKPLLLFLTLPINLITLGLFSFVINAVVLEITTYFVTGFIIDNFMSALLGAVVLTIISTILSTLVKDIKQVR